MELSDGSGTNVVAAVVAEQPVLPSVSALPS